MMLKNYFTVTVRGSLRQKGYTFINIFGFTMGLLSCLLIFLWVKDEIGYDSFNKNAANLGRTIIYADDAHWALSPGPLAAALKAEVPQVVDASRYKKTVLTIKYGDNLFTENGADVDPSFLNMFTYPVIKGNPTEVLKSPTSIVFTRSMARKYFGDENPIGKVVKLNNFKDYTVTGIIENIPHNSHLKFDFLLSMERHKNRRGNLDKWDSMACFTYLQLQDNYSRQQVQTRLTRSFRSKLSGTDVSGVKVLFQPLEDIHLHSNYRFDIEGHGNIKYVNIFALMGILILVIACINYMNLATARSGNRAKEVGLRKVMGASRPVLMKQFFTESVFITFIALGLALILVEFLLPTFSNIARKPLESVYSFDIPMLSSLVGMALFTGLAAGLYPALFLSSLTPQQILKGFTKSGKGVLLFRKVLVVIQFSLMVILIIGTTVVYTQLDYIRNKDLGFDKNNLVYMRIEKNHKQLEVTRNELLKSPGISAVTAMDTSLVAFGNGTTYVEWEGKKVENRTSFQFRTVDYDFLKTFNVKLVEGRFFSREQPTDFNEAYVLNEAAVKAMELKNSEAVGQRLSLQKNSGKIIGVIKDYHYRSLHNAVEPLILRMSGRNYYFLFARVDSKDIPGSVDFIRSKWGVIDPGFPFEYTFLSEELDYLYKDEKRIATLFRYFTILAIIISCLGMFGLASFMAERQTKEIGIRKVLGASVSSIVYMFSREFGKWVLLSIVIGAPLAYYYINRWLEIFVYRITIGPDIILFAALLAFGTALISVAYRVVKAALANPIEALKYE